MRDAPTIPELLAFAAAAMRRKLAFAGLIAAFVLALVWYSTGFSVISVVITIITVFIFGLFAFLVWFWTDVFVGTGGKGPRIVDMVREAEPREMKEVNPRPRDATPPPRELNPPGAQQ